MSRTVKVSLAECEAADRAEHIRKGHHSGNYVASGFLWLDGRLVPISDVSEFYSTVGAKLFGESITAGDADRGAAFMEVLNRLFQFPLNSRLKKGCEPAIARRFIAMAWVLNPKLFDGASLSEVARSLGISPAAVAISTGEFSREFGVRALHQSHGAGKFKPVEAVGVHDTEGEDCANN